MEDLDPLMATLSPCATRGHGCGSMGSVGAGGGGEGKGEGKGRGPRQRSSCSRYICSLAPLPQCARPQNRQTAL